MNRTDPPAATDLAAHLDRDQWGKAHILRRHLFDEHGRGTTRPSWERLLRYHAEAHADGGTP